MTQPVIRFADQGDVDAVASLLRAMDRHYRPDGTLPEPAAYHAMIERCMREREGTRFALAFVGGRPAGIACIAILRPGRDLAGLIYLKDLYVPEEERSRGIGSALMRFLARFARDQRIGRIDLQTDARNSGARSLYERLDGEQKDKVCFSFDDAALKALADTAP